MKNFTKSALYLAMLSAPFISLSSTAETVDGHDFSYQYIEAASINSKADKLDDESLTGFGLQASFEMTNNVYLKVLYAKSDADISAQQNFNVDSKSYYLGVGYFESLNTDTDWYTELAVDKLKATFIGDEGNDFDDTIYSYSATIGLRHQLFTDAEIEGSLKHLYNQNGSEFSARVGAYYSVFDYVDVGVNYEFGTEIDTLAASIRVEF